VTQCPLLFCNYDLNKAIPKWLIKILISVLRNTGSTSISSPYLRVKGSIFYSCSETSRLLREDGNPTTKLHCVVAQNTKSVKIANVIRIFKAFRQVGYYKPHNLT
jgi:hypothetical protein